jgi:hypothetical protein
MRSMCFILFASIDMLGLKGLSRSAGLAAKRCKATCA